MSGESATLYLDLKTRFDNVEDKLDSLINLSKKAAGSISDSFKKVTFTNPPIAAYEKYIDAKNRLDSKSYKDFAEYEKLKTQVENLESHKRLQEYIKYKNQEKQYYDNIGKSMTVIGTKLSIGVTAPLVLIASQALKTAGSFEQYKVSFETMLKSTDKANALLKDIEKFSSATPFQLPNLVVGAKRLLVFGVESDKVVEKLRNLGNAAGGQEEILDRLTLAYGKLQAKGKASMEELNMFIEAGVPLLDELAKGFNVTTAELSEMITKGQVGFNDVDAALTRLTTGTGQFAGMIEKQSTTLNGIVSTMKDNVGLLGKDIISVILPDLKRLASFVSDVANGFRNMDEGTKKTIVTIGAVAAAAGPLLIIGGKLLPLVTAIPGKVDLVVKSLNALRLAAIANPVLAIAGAVTVAAVAFGTWYASSHDMNNINNNLKSSTENLKTSLEAYKEVVKTLTKETTKLGDEEKNLLNIQKQKLEFDLQKQVNDIIVAYNKIKGATSVIDTGGMFKSLEGPFEAKFFSTLEERKTLIKQIEDEMSLLNKQLNDGADQITFLDRRLGTSVTKNSEQTRKYLQELYRYYKVLNDPVDNFENNLQQIAPIFAEMNKDAELYQKTLKGMGPEIKKDFEIILGKLETQKQINQSKEEEKKKIEQSLKAEKELQELLKQRKEFLKSLEDEISKQGKTELQQIQASRQAELEKAAELWKNTSKIEEYNKVKADINKKYDFQIAEYQKKIEKETLQSKLEMINQSLSLLDNAVEKEINIVGGLKSKEIDTEKNYQKEKERLLNEALQVKKQILTNEHNEVIAGLQKDIEENKSNASLKKDLEKQMLTENERYQQEIQRLNKETTTEIAKEFEKQKKDHENYWQSLSGIWDSGSSHIADSFNFAVDATQVNYAGAAASVGNMTKNLSGVFSNSYGGIIATIEKYNAVIASSASETEKANAQISTSVGIATQAIGAVLQVASAALNMASKALSEETERTLAKIEKEYEDRVSKIENTLKRQTAAIDAETKKQLDALKAYYEERGIAIETGYETELELAEEQYEALLEAKAEYDEEETEQRLAQLESYAESLQGKTDAEIDEALREKEIQLKKKSDKEKLAQDEKINLAKAEVEKQRILDEAEKKKKAAEKKAAMEKYKAEVEMIKAENKAKKEQFEQQKAMSIIQATIGMLLGIAMIWANSFANYPPIPAAVIAAAMTAVMGTLGGIQIGLIASQPPPPEQPIPPPPAFRTGGIAPGQRFEGVDSQDVKVSPKELILNDEQQANLFNAIANNQLGGNTIVEIVAHIYMDSEEIPISKIILNQRRFAGAR